MADSLYDIIAPRLSATGFDLQIPSVDDPETLDYLNAITRLSYTSLATTETEKLASQASSITKSLQSLASRSYRGILTSTNHLDEIISKEVPQIRSVVERLSEDEIPKLDHAAMAFAKKYSRAGQNETLARRREVLTLAGSADRIADILDIPTLLSSAIAAGNFSQMQSQRQGHNQGQPRLSSVAVNSSYTSALDLFSHVKRLQMLYPHSRLIQKVSQEASEEMKRMTTNLLVSLQSKNLKLAGAMRTVGWLRRIAPELDSSWDWCPNRSAAGDGSGFGANTGTSSGTGSGIPTLGTPNLSSEGSLGAVLLLCRLANLLNTLNALEPLQELADQEARKQAVNSALPRSKLGVSSSASIYSISSPVAAPLPAASTAKSFSEGQQTEQYLKRYIEVFREQSFAIVSMFKGVFAVSKEGGGTSGLSVAPSSPATGMKLPTCSPSLHSDQMSKTTTTTSTSTFPPFPAIPSALASFPLHLSNLLFSTLRVYLPVLPEGPVREGVCSQVLFCANSLGRLGADFGLLLASLLDTLETGGEGGDSESDNDGDDGDDDGGNGGRQREEDAREDNDDDKEGRDPGWIDVFKKHKVQVSRLEMLASGVAATAKYETAVDGHNLSVGMQK